MSTPTPLTEHHEINCFESLFSMEQLDLDEIDRAECMTRLDQILAEV